MTFTPGEVKLDLENVKKFVERIKKYITEESEEDHQKEPGMTKES